MKNEINLNKLEDILKTLKTYGDASPSEVFKQNARIRILNQISVEPSFETNKNRKKYFSFRLALALVLLLILIPTGTILAAQSAGPKNKLYPIKIASENIALKLSPPQLKPSIALEIVKRREEEISNQKSQNNDMQQEINRYKESIDNAKSVTPSNDSAINNELNTYEKNMDKLINNDENGRGQNQVPMEQKSDSSLQNSENQNVKGDSTENKNQQPHASKSPESSPTFNPVENVQKGIEDTMHNLTATPTPEPQDR